MAFSSEMVEEIGATAGAFGIETAALLAAVEVESSGSFYAEVDGQVLPPIRWEAHYFHRLLPPELRSAAVAEGLAAPYGGVVRNPRSQRRRYRLLERAKALHESAALGACAWGVGRVLGVNWEWLGYPSVQALAADAMSGLGGQVRIMVRFLDRSDLLGSLRRKDWEAFARGYNGPGYRRLRYDQSLQAAYRRYAGHFATEPDMSELLRMGSRGAEVARIQRLLRQLGYTLMLDGDFGPGTTAAVRRFQADHDLPVDGILGPKTEAALEALNGSMEVESKLRRGSRGAAVFELQQQLNALGYRLAEDGYLGPRTAVALMRFQRAAGLVVDGTVGAATLAAVDRTLETRRFAAAS